jgi:15-cis-phytoene synthase
VLAYGVRVASSVGVVMTLLMGRRDHATLARACDLGAAMQLTNLARDVVEDARRGRLYLPLSWLHTGNVGLDAFLSTPAPSDPVRAATLRLLDEADRLYTRAHAGIDMLPADCRPAIRAASAIYRDIGRVIRRRGGDGISSRARLSGLRKLWLVGRAAFPSPSASPMPDLAAPPLAPAAALVEAVARLDREALLAGVLA